MKKILALILTILMVMFAFTSCGFKLDLSSAFEPKDETKNELNDEENYNEDNETEASTDETDYMTCAHTGGTATCKTNAKCAACGELYGELKSDNHEGVLEWIKTAETHKKAYNCCGEVVTEQGAHSYKNSVCEICEHICTHAFSNGKCGLCDITLYNLNRNTKKITFGSYPQTKVTDEALVTTLNTKAGTLPTAENKQAWTSYGYYGYMTDYMWYIDVTEGREKYRGVYFTSYRMYRPDDPDATYYTFQDDNGYTTSTVYWFKYEPISWTILSENTTDGTALIFCDMIIDSQAYQDIYQHGNHILAYYNTSTGVPSGTFASNYAYSTIRKWLNETFYNTTFNELQKKLIVTTTVDNSAESTGYTGNSYACDDTQDKIFLLSYEEVTNEDYSLNTSTARQKKTTDYAQAQGVYTYSGGSYDGNGDWWLRSPYHLNPKFACGIYNLGGAGHYDDVSNPFCGVVPALQIKLS